MNRAAKTTVGGVLVLTVVACAVSGLYAQASPDVGGAPQSAGRPAAGAQSPEPTGESSLRVEGDAEAVRLDVRRTTVGDVLAQLAAAFDVSYRASIALNDERNGTYAGSLAQVIVRLLDGYDYVIRQQGASLDVTVLEKVGEQAVVAPRPHPVSEHRARLRAARR